MTINVEERVERARNYFLEGYNCAQAVVMAFDDKGQAAYFFLESIVRPMIEYYNTYSSTAFGNPDLSRMEGKFIGFCMGKGWDIDEDKDKIIIKSAKGRKLYYIEKPCTPKDEIEKRKDIARMMNELGL
jgi:hypothetical protein